MYWPEGPEQQALCAVLVLHGRPDKPREQGMRDDRFALEFGMELDAHEPGVILDFHNLYQVMLGEDTRARHTKSCEAVPIGIVKLEAVPVPLIHNSLSVE
jgi:hypothetical protein